ncbi:efflux RND transporter periplasmic adaptor subunit [Dendrosporobacter sp. 1207_IL3150]|uniref:efflux RND transporter periplasmic adaptor subunit n=1 Tax=Dendrosporobacter sp. 1207_IL3150 TaxID=3084054 RepID=UPI002FDA925D
MVTNKRKVICIASIVAVLLVGLIGYRIYANLAANKERAGKVSQGRIVTVEVSKVERRDITPIITYSASLEPVWQADISSKIDGRIDSLHVEEGDYVQEGSIIAVLDTNELLAQVIQAEGNLLSSQASLEQAEQDLRRTEALAGQGAISLQALDAARSKRDLSTGQVRSAQGNLTLLKARLDNANILAPRSGVIIKRHMQSGFFAKAGSPIVTIADINSLLAKTSIGEGQINEISVGNTVKIRVDAIPDKDFSGTITRISPAAALPARTFTADVTIPNSEGILKAGMFAKVSSTAPIHKNIIAIPEGALVMREDQKTTFVVKADNKVEQRVLKVGFVGGGWAEVIEGLSEGERIVTSGQNKLKDGSSISLTKAAEGGV